MKCYVTNTVASDGYGSKLGRILNLMYFTYYAREKYNIDIEFLYSPLYYEGFGKTLEGLRDIACYYTSREAYIERARQWENKLNYNGKKITDIDIKPLKLIYHVDYATLINSIINNNYDNKLLVINNLYGTSPGSSVAELEKIFSYQDDVIKKFDIVNPVANNKLNISFHIRRDTITPTGFWKERWLDDEYYLDMIKVIENKLKKDYELTIYTQTNGFNYEKFKDYKIIYDETSQDYDCFINFVFSDILAMSISSFSLSASYLSKNTFINPPTNYWIKRESWLEKKDLEEYIKFINEQ